jgi:hypothetical protein
MSLSKHGLRVTRPFDRLRVTPWSRRDFQVSRLGIAHYHDDSHRTKRRVDDRKTLHVAGELGARHGRREVRASLQHNSVAPSHFTLAATLLLLRQKEGMIGFVPAISSTCSFGGPPNSFSRTALMAGNVRG